MLVECGFCSSLLYKCMWHGPFYLTKHEIGEREKGGEGRRGEGEGRTGGGGRKKGRKEGRKGGLEDWRTGGVEEWRSGGGIEGHTRVKRIVFRQLLSRISFHPRATCLRETDRIHKQTSKKLYIKKKKRKREKEG